MKVYSTIVYTLGIAFCVALALFPKTAPAQHNHDAGHPDYQNWQSRVTDNCCNNQDCGELAEDEVQETPIGYEVKIEGLWCPVKAEHYIVRGKSPNWTKAHACINRYANFSNPCDALLCFAGHPKF